MTIQPSNDGPMERLEPEVFDRGNPNRRCTAHRKNGERCRKWAIRGGNVCTHHGGKANHIREKAQRRLSEAADRMAARLLGIAESQNVPAYVALQAINSALDRAGVVQEQKVDVSVGIRPFESVMEAAVIESGSRSDYRRANGIPDPQSLSIPLPDNDYSVGAIVVDGEVVSPYAQNSTLADDPALTGQSMPEGSREPLRSPLALPLGESGYLPADEAVGIAADVNRRHRSTLGRI